MDSSPPPPPSSTPAGWYDEPGGQPGHQRYWDGSSWTQHTHSPERPYSQPQGGQTAATASGGRASPTMWWQRPWVLVVSGLLLLIVIAAALSDPEDPNQSGGGNGDPASEGAATTKKKPSGPRKVPKLKGERLDVAEDLLDEKGLKYKEVGGGSLGVVDTGAWEVCETRPKAGKRTKATVRLVVGRPGECGKKDSVADSGGGGGGDDDLGGLFEGDVKASKIRSVPIGSTKSTVRSKLGKPSDDQEFASKGDGEAGLDDECWYYDDEDFNSWQLCFSNGKLTGRNKY